VKAERASTPIHPNQVVGGINFIETKDPDHIPSQVFQQCMQPAEVPGSATFSRRQSPHQKQISILKQLQKNKQKKQMKIKLSKKLN
jgi:hypothetical protein